MRRYTFLALCGLLLVALLSAANYTLPTQNVLVAYTTQTIAAGGIIAADSCGGMKLVSAAGAVSTDATNGIAASSMAGCCFNIVNVSSGANTITLKHSANVLTLTGADLALAQNGVVSYCTNGSKWFQIAPLGTNS